MPNLARHTPMATCKQIAQLAKDDRQAEKKKGLVRTRLVEGFEPLRVALPFFENSLAQPH